MEIRIRLTGQVMMESEFRDYIATNNGPTWDITTEEIVNSLDADIVFEGPQASGGTVYQYSMRQGVEQLQDGKWYTKYVLGPIFVDTETETAKEQEDKYKLRKDEEQGKNIRTERNKKLTECDWTQLDDTPLTNAKKLEWAEYRQALRDVPTQSGFPWEVVWPDKP